MSFENGDSVAFNFAGKSLPGIVSGRAGDYWLVQYSGVFPSGFSSSKSVQILHQDMALKDGDIFLVDGDMAMTGQATIQCKFEDLTRSS